MSTDPARWKQIEELFHAALDLPAGERAAWLSQQDADLAREAQALIDAYEEQEQIAPEPASAAEPEQFGPYRTDRKIGEGGMGVVYLAHRADGQFEHRVAIKVVSRRGLGDVFLERFRTERQILASLNHPGIARLLDGGVAADGSLYLAMEFVEGVPIDRYCDDHSLARRARLVLFQSVCAAVQYAHRNLVVHRDLKPDNILVQPDGVAKLLDFGTAKLTTPLAESADSDLTKAGFHAYTPAYASPEQILGNPVTTATDIYSLGVILYRLLAGRPPYELKDHRTSELIEVICERVPDRADIDPDLDAILAKCLRKIPEERYRSADELNDDIGFYLQGRPVLARQGSLRYRAWKFASRNKASVAVAAVLAASIVLGLAGILWQARIARSRYQDLRRLTNSILFELDGVIRDLPGSTAAQKLLVTRVLDSLDKLSRESANDRVIQSDLTEAYLKMGNLQGNPYEQNLGDMEGGLATLRKALGISDRLVEQQPSDRAALRTHAMLRQSIGDILFGRGKAKDAIAMTTDAAATLEKLASESNAPASAIAEAASSYETLGDEYGQSGNASLGDVQSALAQYQKALALQKRAIAADPSYFRPKRGVAVVQMKIGMVQLTTDPAQALESFLTALHTFDALPEKDAATMGSRRIRLSLLRKAGSAYEALEQWDAALSSYLECQRIQETFVTVDPDDYRAQFELAIILNQIAIVQGAKGDLQPAYDSSNRVATLLEGIIRKDPNNPIWRGHLTDVQLRIAGLLRDRGSAAEASRLNATALAATRTLAASPEATRLDICRAGDALAASDPPLAVTYAERCVAENNRQDPESFIKLAAAHRASGRSDDARNAAQQGLALLPLPSPGKPPNPARRRLEAFLK